MSTGVCVMGLFARLEEFRPSDVISGARQGRRTASFEYTPLLLIALSVIILPLAYAFCAYGVTSPSNLEPMHLRYIAVNVGANLLCAIIGLQLKGRLAHRLNSAMIMVICVHAAILVAVVSFRLYYSRPIMLSAFLASLVIVNCLVVLSERTRPRRMGIVPQATSNELIDWVGPRGQVILSEKVPPTTFDLVLADLSREMDPRWNRYIANAMLSGVEVRHLAEYVEGLRGRVSADLFQVDHVLLDPRAKVYLHLKRYVDVLLVLLLLPIAAPLAIFGALAIAVSMGRPILFVQDRIGLEGTTFRIYKLRTMEPEGQQLPGNVRTATKVGDRRVTPLGQWLRLYRLDELPQLWNVLRGDMSMVGPRPEQPHLCSEYANAMPTFPCRHLVRPGITGWAQVRFGYACDERETREKLSYDLYYTKYISAALDLKILLETILVILRDKTAR